MPSWLISIFSSISSLASPITAAFTATGQAISSTFTYLTQRDKEANTPDIVANKTKANEQAALDAARKTVAEDTKTNSLDAERRADS